MVEQVKDQSLISFGIETFDKFLGGGFLHSSLNLFERHGPSSRLLDTVWNKAFAASTLHFENKLIEVNFNSLVDKTPTSYVSSLPGIRRVKTEQMYKDIRGRSGTAEIKIAWRYSSRSRSPSDNGIKMDQVDFGSMGPNYVDMVRIINVKQGHSMKEIFSRLEQELVEMKSKDSYVNILISDILHPFSILIDDPQNLCKFMYLLRSFSRRMIKGAILVSFDTDMCSNHLHIKDHLYNLADCVVSFFSFETGQNILTGYKHMDGTMDYIKCPKINSFGPHFQRELSDWGYRLTRNERFFMVDELNLPPCYDETTDVKSREQNASDILNIEHKLKPLKQVGPLEDFRQVAQGVLAKQL